MIEYAWPEMDGSFQADTWLSWADALPPELIRSMPVLSVAYAWAMLNMGDLEAAESRLQDAAQWLDGTTTTGMIVVDDEQFLTLPASIASARAYIAQARGDVAGTIAYAEQALALAPKDDYVRRGPAASLLGLAYWGQGELEAAYRALAEAMDGFRLAGSTSFAISGTYGLADIRVAQGRLREAINVYEQSLHLVDEQESPAIRGTAELYLGLSLLHREQGNADTAAEYLSKSLELGESAALANWPNRMRIVRARFQEDAGDPNGALDLLDEAARFYFPTPVPDPKPVAAMKARIWITQGRLSDAWAWANEQGLSIDGDLSYLREFEYLTLARLLIAQYRADGTNAAVHEAIELLARLLHAAEAGGRMGSVIEILILQALAYQTQGDASSALEPLARALVLAEPEGYIRIFADEGEPMAGLLSVAAENGIAPDYIRRLLMATDKTETPIVAGLLTDPLSDRELDVLRLLGTELSGPEIANELMVSLNTMRTHTKNIYSKLGVNSRRAAVRRAEELDLL
ncbi:MAG: tetratricopeptide repeat protein [Chloroflexota bacterium]